MQDKIPERTKGLDSKPVQEQEAGAGAVFRGAEGEIKRDLKANGRLNKAIEEPEPVISHGSRSGHLKHTSASV